MVGRFNFGFLLLWRTLSLAREKEQSLLPPKMGKVRPDGSRLSTQSEMGADPS
jgi:hypothetical protein